jgi:hypothetical protein
MCFALIAGLTRDSTATLSQNNIKLLNTTSKVTTTVAVVNLAVIQNKIAQAIKDKTSTYLFILTFNKIIFI